MQYLLFGTDDPYEDGIPGGADAFIHGYRNLADAQHSATSLGLKEAHIATFDGSDMRIVSRLEWVQAPVADPEAYLRKAQKRLDRQHAAFMNKRNAEGDGQVWYFSAAPAQLPTVRAWVDEPQLAAGQQAAGGD